MYLSILIYAASHTLFRKIKAYLLQRFSDEKDKIFIDAVNKIFFKSSESKKKITSLSVVIIKTDHNVETMLLFEPCQLCSTMEIAYSLKH